MQGTWGSVLSLAVLLGGGVLVDRLGASRLQWWVLVSMATFLLVFSSLAASWGTYAVGLAGLALVNLSDPLLSISAMSLLMAYCRPKIEGSQFTAYMALVSMCTVMASYSWLLEVTTAPRVGLGCGLLLAALMLALHRLVPTAKAAAQAQLAAPAAAA